MTQDDFRDKLSRLVQDALDAGLPPGEIDADLEGQKMMLAENYPDD